MRIPHQYLPRYHWLRWTLAALGCSVLTACATAPEGRSPLANQPLQSHDWQLRSIQSASGVQPPWFVQAMQGLRTPIVLRFGSERLAMSGPCNHIGAGYQLDGNAIRIAQAMATKRACMDGALMELENQLVVQLSQSRFLQISDTTDVPVLQLQFADGSLWQLEGRLTRQAQLGTAPELVFLEVAPQTQTCQDGLRQRQCLQARTVRFDDSGLRQASSPWELFYDDIEGFEHEPGVRSVLRLKRYALADPPADASRYVYVLDLQISSELVP